MRKVFVTAAVVVATVVLVAGSLVAGASLPVTKPPLQPVPSWTGPQWDPDATRGQWTQRMDMELHLHNEVSSHEFYDNLTGYGGGSSSSSAIYGKAANIEFYQGNIVAFAIVATITNDTPTYTQWLEGGNSLGETTNTRTQYVGTLYDTKLTASFAFTGAEPSSWTMPYSNPGGLPFIGGSMADGAAWYGWTPGNPVPTKQNTGGFWVPMWRFGDIPVGESRTKTLHFTVDPRSHFLTPDDPRYDALMDSYNAPAGQGDLFMNRTKSLKISNWLDALDLDPGTAYPGEAGRSSNVSVFHNVVPEPSSLLALLGGIGALGAAIRRRK